MKHGRMMLLLARFVRPTPLLVPSSLGWYAIATFAYVVRFALKRNNCSNDSQWRLPFKGCRIISSSRKLRSAKIRAKLVHKAPSGAGYYNSYNHSPYGGKLPLSEFSTQWQSRLTWVDIKLRYISNYQCTVHTTYSVIGYSAKSDIVSTLGWYRIPYTNNYWI